MRQSNKGLYPIEYPVLKTQLPHRIHIYTYFLYRIDRDTKQLKTALAFPHVNFVINHIQLRVRDYQ